MFKSRPSTPATINVILIVVITAILVSFVVIDFIQQRDRSHGDLRRELTSLTRQLGSSLALPLWNFQDDQAARILENALANPSVVAVAALDTITHREVAALARTADGGFAPLASEPDSGETLFNSSPITYNNRDIGIVKVWGTSAHVREALLQNLYRLVAGIALINAALVAILSLVLNRTLVRPLKSVETYALAVSLREGADAPRPSGYFLKEMENLCDSIVIMVAKLKERYRLLKESQAGLAEAEARYRNLYENALAGIFRCSPDGVILSANQAMARILGHESPKALFMATFDDRFVDEQELGEFRTRMGQAGEVSGFTVCFRRADGDERIGTLHARVIHDEEGSTLFIDGMLEDITDRTRAEERLREAHGFIQNILDSMPSMMVGIDAAMRVTHVNRPAELAMGMDHDQIIGRGLTDVLPRMAAHLDTVGDALRGATPAVLANRPHFLGGRTRQENIMVFPVVQNGIPGAVIRIDDVTDQARMEELIIQTEKMMSLGGLAAGMAHEINNPLAGILQGVQNIIRRTSPALPANKRVAQECGCDLENVNAYLERREIHEFLSGIKESGQRAAKIVSNMLSFTRRAQAMAVAVNLEELLDRSLELASTDYDLKKKYDFKQIEIIRDYQPDMPPVFCYPMEIEQVLINLLRNAAQAMSVHPRAEHPRIALRLRAKAKAAVIEVEDNGPGMEESVRSRVFDPFFTTKSPGEGTGLGLSVSYFIVSRNHGGSIHVESEPGRGAKFVITLPLREGGTGAEA